MSHKITNYYLNNFERQSRGITRGSAQPEPTLQCAHTAPLPLTLCFPHIQPVALGSMARETPAFREPSPLHWVGKHVVPASLSLTL